MKKLTFLLLILLTVFSCKKENNDSLSPPEEPIEEPINEGENFITPSPETKLLEPQNYQLLNSFQSDQIIFNDPGEVGFLDSLMVGDIIVSGTNDVAIYGFLKRVTSIQRDGGEVILGIDQAFLDEAFIDGIIKVEAQLNPDDTLRDLEFKVDKSLVMYDKDGNHSTTFDQIKIDGDLSTKFGMGMEIDIGKRTFKLTNDVKHSGTVNLNWELTDIGGIGLTIDKEKKMYTWALAPIWITVGAWPIIITPRVDIVGKVEGSLKGSAAVELNISATGNTYIEYENGWTTGGDESQEVTPSIEAALESELKISLGPQISFRPYGMDIAESTVALSSFANATGSVGTSGTACEIKAGVSLDGIVNLNFFSLFNDEKFEENITKKEYSIWTCLGCDDVLISFDVDFNSGQGLEFTNIVGGFPPYTYAVNSSSFQTDPVFNISISPGDNLLLKVKDAEDCITEINYMVASCNDGVQNGDEEGVDCGGSFCPPCGGNPCNTTSLAVILAYLEEDNLHILAEGGAPPYQYSIDGGQSFHSNDIFTEIPSSYHTGSLYDIHVKDQNDDCASNDIFLERSAGVFNGEALVETNSFGTCMAPFIDLPFEDLNGNNVWRVMQTLPDLSFIDFFIPASVNLCPATYEEVDLIFGGGACYDDANSNLLITYTDLGGNNCITIEETVSTYFGDVALDVQSSGGQTTVTGNFVVYK